MILRSAMLACLYRPKYEHLRQICLACACTDFATISVANIAASSQLKPSPDYSRSYGSIVPFPLAQTGEGISECELISWSVKEGDAVQQFDHVCEVQSDKATVEITSRYTGIVRKLHAQPGDIVKVGATLVDIELEDSAVEQPGNAASQAGLGGEQELHQQCQSDAKETTAGLNASSALAHGPLSVHASPAVRALARQLDIRLHDVAGTGPEGRITKTDVVSWLEQQRAHSPAPEPHLPTASTPEALLRVSAAAAAIEVPSSNNAGFDASPADTAQSAANGPGGVPAVLEPIRGYRRAMVSSMTRAASVPTFHFMDEMQLDDLVVLRGALQGDSALMGTRLTFLPFFIKALSISLAQWPILNSSLDEASTSLLKHEHHNVGIAMATPVGLVVPNIKNVEAKGVVAIATELVELQRSAAANRMAPGALLGGTITVSNIGSIGGTYATPLVTPPEVAIVALGKIQQLPRFTRSGDVASRAIMKFSWAADHRVIDGATLASFSNFWRSLLESPARLLLHLK